MRVPQEHFVSTLGHASRPTHIFVDSLAIFSSPTGKSPLSRWRAGTGAMGTSDECHVLFTNLRDCCDCLPSGDEGDLPEMTGVVATDFENSGSDLSTPQPKTS